MILAWLIVPAAYVLGSVSFAYLAGKYKGLDLRQHGSKNLGATNAGRVLGKTWFISVFLADLLKGFVAVVAAKELTFHGASPWLPLATATAVILGHSFTCFHGFKGGKAVATSLGVLIGLIWKVAALCFGVWMVVWLIGLWVVRIGAANSVGPASIIAALSVPAALFIVLGHPFAAYNLALTIFCLLMSALVVVRHRSNIMRMLHGAHR